MTVAHQEEPHVAAYVGFAGRAGTMPPYGVAPVTAAARDEWRADLGGAL
jgi:hypothetical protein